MAEISAHEYRALIRSALRATVDSDTDAPDFQRLYTPDTHRRALEPDVTVVRGARGVGKTVWFKSLQEDALRTVAAESYRIPALNRVRPLRGFGSERRPDNYPGAIVLKRLLAEGCDPYDIWVAVLLHALDVNEVRERPDWLVRTRWVQESPEQVEHALARADANAETHDQTVLILFDALDRLHEDRHQADRLARGILRLALELRLSSRNIRAKIFIRPDMLESSSLDFTDSSKLVSNTADLSWSNTNLFGLFFHYLGNFPDASSERFRAVTAPPDWRDVGGGSRFIAPEHVSSDRKSQQSIFTTIAGPYMGTDHRKGHTYSWLPNHLMDGAEQVSPRSFLSALARAAELTANSYGGHDRPLHYEAIRSGVQHASRIRVQEIREDIPWVASVVEVLEGIQVPVERESIHERWHDSGLIQDLSREYGGSSTNVEVAKTGPQDISANGLIEELNELGVMTYRRDGRIDLPDVYRIAFNIGRKGGVPKVAR